MIPILLYHSVPRTAQTSERFSVAFSTFIAHIDAIVESERTPITVGQLASGLRNECALPDRAMAITFDDFYDDTPSAVEALCARGLCASVFVTTGKIETEPVLWHDGLLQLAALPRLVEIGAHSVTHPHLDELSVTEIQTEVRDSKHQLEHLVQKPVDTFAYPYGAYDQRVRDAVIAAGFTSAAAVKNALSHRGDDPWAIARWSVESATSAGRIAQVLDGRNVPRAWRGERLRTRGYRVVRRLRRRGRQAA